MSAFVPPFRFVKEQPRRDKKYVDLGPKREQVDHIRNYQQNKAIERTNLINKVSENYVNADVVDTRATKSHTSLHIGEDWTLKRARDKSVIVDK